MALKLKIRPELEKEMEILVSKAKVRSKTEYINRAIEEYNRKLKREIELAKLQVYFQSYQKEGQKVLSEFSRLRKNID
ncbi:MAG: hypothetical protein HYU97_04030 [Deltaproteobacteria bacterium]|nr:hypothetical protein [Deltaproteobacteria bacterium]